MNIKQQLIEFEGKKNIAYPDPLTNAEPWTIGVGHTGPQIRPGLVWDDALVDATLDADISECKTKCINGLPWFNTLNAPRQAVLLSMCFQMGMNGLLKFKETLAAIRDERFEHAAECMRRSLWAKQTPGRAKRLAQQMATGEWA